MKRTETPQKGHSTFRSPSREATPVLRQQELRIGNILKNKKGRMFVVTAANIGKIADSVSTYRPVALTDQILRSCGICRSSKGNKYCMDAFDGYYFMFTGRIGMMYKVDLGTIGHPIRYIHQLQNLYYSLTGRELRMIAEQNDRSDAP
ncbi:MAG: hypothetical protein LIP08_15770 [Bacteroides sp.]|nr:hypothetical protein [Bacteroides sp.]